MTKINIKHIKDQVNKNPKMKKIELKEFEFHYLISSNFIPDGKKIMIKKHSKRVNSSYILRISEKTADELRDYFCEELEVAGFDENYYLSQEGKILESLIDKFFCG